MRHLVLCVQLSLVGATLVACAQLPASMKTLTWLDAWGDRGEQVLARDFRMCEELVEQRRSLMEGCMAGRGWSSGGN